MFRVQKKKHPGHILKNIIIFHNLISKSNVSEACFERSGSVVECLTRARGAAGSSLTGVFFFEQEH